MSSARVPAGWTPVRPPFHALTAGLADAEDLLNGDGRTPATASWTRLADAIDSDPTTCAQALNDILADLGVELQPDPTIPTWRVVLTVAPKRSAQEVRAAQALALLIEASGWTRLKRCRHRNCARVFPEATNGCSRVCWRRHPTRPTRT
ncbi:MAG: hypothetical protein L0I24_24145 [Pseudonocardia sp.]|nr:hypothetical protein [Pseudonocardia sp.]